jgi:hypothetical protein
VSIDYITQGNISNSVATLSLTYPAVSAGDLLIAFWTCGNAAGTLTTEPAALTLRGSVSSGNNQQRVYTRLADGSESGTISWTKSASSNQMASIFVYRNAANPTVADYQSATGTGTSSDAPAATAAANNSLVLRIWSPAGNAGTPTHPATTRLNAVQGTGAAGTRLAISEAIQAVAGSTGTANATWSTSVLWLASTLVIQENSGSNGPFWQWRRSRFQNFGRR